MAADRPKFQESEPPAPPVAAADFPSLIQTLLGHTDDIYVVIDRDGICRQVSPAVTPATGWVPEELVGRLAFDFIHPDDQAACLEAHAEVLDRPGASRTLALHLRTKDDRWIRLLSTGTNLTADPLIRGVVLVNRVLATADDAPKSAGSAAPDVAVVFEERNRELLRANRMLLRQIEERHDVEARLRRRLELEEGLALTSRILMSHPVEDFNRILETWGRILDAECVVLGFVDDRLRITAVHEWMPPGSPPGRMFPPDHDLTAYAWAMERLCRNEIIVLDGQSIPPPVAAAERQYLADRRIPASVWIPILASSGQLRGILGVVTAAAAASWKPEDVQFLRISSELIGNYLAASTAERDLRLSEQRLHRMSQALMELTRSEEFVDAEPERLLARMAADIRRTLNVARTWSWLSSRADATGFHDLLPPEHLHPIAELIAAGSHPEPFQRARSIAVADVATDPRTRASARRFLDDGITALLFAPITLEGRFRGVLACEHDGGPRDWTPDEEHFIASMADLVSLALARQARIRAHQALLDSELRVRAMFEGSVIGIVFCTLDGIITEANPAFLTMIGYSAHELRGIHWRELTHPDDIAQEDAIAEIITVGDQNWIPLVKRYRRKDGSCFWAKMTLYVIHQGVSSAEFGFAMVEDITDRRRSEEQLLAYQTQLRTLANELSLAEARLRRKIASDLHDRIGQSLALAKIKLGELRPASGTDAGGPWPETANLIEATIRETRSLISEISPPVLDLLGLEAATEWLVEHLSQQSGVAITLDSDPKPKPLTIEMRDLLFQGVRELLVNAIKHAGARRIRVSLRREHEEVLAVVEDDGKGFAAGSPPAPTTGGFGLFYLRERLGLAGGRLEIGHAKGGGARVTLTLPVAPPNPAPGGNHDPAHPARG